MFIMIFKISFLFEVSYYGALVSPAKCISYTYISPLLDFIAYFMESVIALSHIVILVNYLFIRIVLSGIAPHSISDQLHYFC